MAGLRVGDVANAAVDALQADATLTALLGGTAKVYSAVPLNTSSPYVQVLGGDEVPWAAAASNYDTRDVAVDVDVWSAYRGTKEVDDVASQVVTRLLTASTWAGVSGFAGVLFERAQRPEQQFIGDEVWYRRRVTVRVYLGA